MSWTPTDAQVEKAAWQVADWLSDRDEGPSEVHREAARAVLVAVGPMIAAKVLRARAARPSGPAPSRAPAAGAPTARTPSRRRQADERLHAQHG